MSGTLGDFFREEEERLIREANTPERIAADAELARRATERHKAEFTRGVELGWFDEDGNPLGEPDLEDDE